MFIRLLYFVPQQTKIIQEQLDKLKIYKYLNES